MSTQRLRDAAVGLRRTTDKYPPGVGLALADWLEAAAENAEFMQAVIDAGRGENPHATLSRTPADRLADLILGGTP